MRLVRTAIAILATAAVLLTGAWAGGSCAPARAQPGGRLRAPTAAGLPEARGTIPVAVGDALAVNGHPIQLSVFYTGDAPDQVVAFYAETFRARGLLPIAAADRHLAHVSVLDPNDGLQRGVTALSERPGRTLVVLAVLHPGGVARMLVPAPEAPYPIPVEHRAFLGFSSEDGSARAHSGQFVSSLAPPQLARFYRERLGAQGYGERTEHPGDGLLVFARRSSTVSIALQALDDHGGSAVFVNHVEGSP